MKANFPYIFCAPRARVEGINEDKDAQQFPRGHTAPMHVLEFSRQIVPIEFYPGFY